MLASQVAISLENARLYGELTISVGANSSKVFPLASVCSVRTDATLP
jgi:hypothetical protein